MSPKEREDYLRFDFWLTMVLLFILIVLPTTIVGFTSGWIPGAWYKLTRYPLLVVALGLGLAVILYLIRSRSQLAYGALEMGVGIATLHSAAITIQEADYTRTLAVIAAVYLNARAIDDIRNGWRARSARLSLQ